MSKRGCEATSGVGGFDLVYDGGVVEPDPQDCPWSTGDEGRAGERRGGDCREAGSRKILVLSVRAFYLLEVSPRLRGNRRAGGGVLVSTWGDDPPLLIKSVTASRRGARHGRRRRSERQKRVGLETSPLLRSRYARYRLCFLRSTAKARFCDEPVRGRAPAMHRLDVRRCRTRAWGMLAARASMGRPHQELCIRDVARRAHLGGLDTSVDCWDGAMSS